MDTIANFFKKIISTLSGFALRNLLPAVLILAAGFFAIVIIMKITTKLLDRSKLEKPASTFILAVIRVALFLVLFLIVASSLGIDVTGIIALARGAVGALFLFILNLLRKRKTDWSAVRGDLVSLLLSRIPIIIKIFVIKESNNPPNKNAVI